MVRFASWRRVFSTALSKFAQGIREASISFPLFGWLPFWSVGIQCSSIDTLQRRSICEADSKNVFYIYMALLGIDTSAPLPRPFPQ